MELNLPTKSWSDTQYSDCVIQSTREMKNFEAKNGQYSRIFHEMTMRQRCKNEARNAIKGLKKPFSNLSDSQFIEKDRLDPILSFSINWESDRLEKEWIRAQIHHNTNFGAKKRAKSRFWRNLLEYMHCMNHTKCVSKAVYP